MANNATDGALVPAGGEPRAAATGTQAPGLVAVHTDYVTAQHVQRPRELRAILKQAVDSGEINGSLFYYRWEVSSKTRDGKEERKFVCGPSVKLTNEAARIFGNCVLQQKPVQETARAWIFTSVFIDLETGCTWERQFRMDKQFPIYGKMDSFRKDDIRFQIGQSKASRNVVANALPMIIIEKMKKAALESVRKQIQFKVDKTYNGDIQRVVDELLKAFAEFGVSLADIEHKLGIPRTVWEIDTLVMLYGDHRALESGEHTKDSLYGDDDHEQANAVGQPGEAQAGLSMDDIRRAERPAVEAPPASASSGAPPTAEQVQEPQADDLPTDKVKLVIAIGQMSARITPNANAAERQDILTIGNALGQMNVEALQTALRRMREIEQAIGARKAAAGKQR
jgi:hypothetical protein